MRMSVSDTNLLCLPSFFNLFTFDPLLERGQSIDLLSHAALSPPTHIHRSSPTTIFRPYSYSEPFGCFLLFLKTSWERPCPGITLTSQQNIVLKKTEHWQHGAPRDTTRCHSIVRRANAVHVTHRGHFLQLFPLYPISSLTTDVNNVQLMINVTHMHTHTQMHCIYFISIYIDVSPLSRWFVFMFCDISFCRWIFPMEGTEILQNDL